MTSSFYNTQLDLVNKVVIDFLPEMMLNTTLDNSSARLGHPPPFQTQEGKLIQMIY